VATVVRHQLQRQSSSALDAFEQIYRANVDAVLGYFARRCRQPQTVADLTAETFHAAARSFADFDPNNDAPREWVFGIALRVFDAQTCRRDDPPCHRQLDDDEFEELERRIDSERTSAGE
jgi:RNA polymerase sigma-70 factor (ECF subfamily)